MVISKSEFMLFLRHPAWLWLKKFDKDKIPLPAAALQALFDEGTLFESYAEKLFPDAVKLGYKNGTEFSGTKYYALPEETAKELKRGTKVILQGRLEVDNITSVFDVLERTKGNTYNLYEIKSSTSAKPEHTYDLAFQTIVLESAGLSIDKISVIHVNNKYVRDGDIDLNDIAVTTEVTEEVRGAIDETKENIAKAFKFLSKREYPDLSPRYLSNGNLSEWLPIVEAAKGPLPEYSIYHLCTLKPELVGLLEDAGVTQIGDIPLDLGLTDKQLKQVVATKTGEREIHPEEIKEFIDTFVYPLYFFDYETLSSVIPAFDGTKPYQQVPFQYSLHIQDSPVSELVHKEYLHVERTNPVPSLIAQMQKDFGGSGTIVSWNKKFEIARNNEMALAYPEHANFLHNLNDRMVDLMVPFSNGWFVDKDFFGSASLKAVLPVLAPHLSYKALAISNGADAQRIWMDTVLGGKNQAQKDQIFKDLREYCKLDTYSMYAVLQQLSEEIGLTSGVRQS